MNLPFRDAIAPLPGEAGGNRAEVVLQTVGEAGQFRNPTPRHLCYPHVQVVATALAYEAQKGQGNRTLSCSGEHRQQVVFVETTEKPFLSQANLVYMLLPQ